MNPVRENHMKLIDAIKLKGRAVEIPDASRDDLPAFFKEMGYKKGVEIGVDRGEFSVKFAELGFEFYAVDPWLSYGDYTDSRGQARLDFLYEHTSRLLSPYPNTKILRETSLDAVERFPDESLDFVYIDGNHQFRYVADDLFEWSKKIKTGGVVSGHDYIYTNPRTQAGICHVIPVVNAFTEAYRIKDWYLIGEKHAKEGEKRDKFRSFMWIKPEGKKYEI